MNGYPDTRLTAEVDRRAMTRWRAPVLHRALGLTGLDPEREIVVDGSVCARLLGLRLLTIELRLLIQSADIADADEPMASSGLSNSPMEVTQADTSVLPMPDWNSDQATGASLPRAEQLLREGAVARAEARRLR